MQTAGRGRHGGQQVPCSNSGEGSPLKVKEVWTLSATAPAGRHGPVGSSQLHWMVVPKHQLHGASTGTFI